MFALADLDGVVPVFLFPGEFYSLGPLRIVTGIQPLDPGLHMANFQ
jgi:hypothetical protein